MAAAIGARMAAGLLVFVILARHLGPTDFGLVSAIFAYGGLAGLITDFGLTTKLLRDMAERPEAGGAALARGLVIKVLNTAFAAALGAGWILLTPSLADQRTYALLFAAGVLIGSIGDFATTAYRAAGQYRAEAINVCLTSAFYLGAVGAVALLGGDAVIMGAAFLAARTLFLILAVRGARRFWPQPEGDRITVRSLAESGRGALPWAMDSGLGYLNGQMDVLLLPQMVGLAQAGIYFAANRFVIASLAVVAVLSNLHIPRVAAATPGPARRDASRRMLIEFTLLGLACGAAFLIGGPLITSIALGPAYAAADALWPGFALFVTARYASAGIGAALAARGLPRLRIAGQVMGLVTILAASWLLPSEGKAVLMPWIMAAGALTTFAAYAIGGWLSRDPRT